MAKKTSLFEVATAFQRRLAEILGLDLGIVVAGSLRVFPASAQGPVEVQWAEVSGTGVHVAKRREVTGAEAEQVLAATDQHLREWNVFPRPSAAEVAAMFEQSRIYPPADSAWVGDRPRSSPPVDPHPVLHWGSPEWLEMERRQGEERARLVEAATYLRGLAAAGTPGDWEAMLLGSEGSSILAGRSRVARVYESADAAWVSALPPSVVGPLVAEWLESVAGSLEVDEPANAANEAEQLAESLLRHKARSS